MDVLAVREAVRKATEYVRAGNVCCNLCMYVWVYKCMWLLRLIKSTHTYNNYNNIIHSSIYINVEICNFAQVDILHFLSACRLHIIHC